MAKSNQRPTMADVAREAGVALGTVSKVVNNQNVGEEYRLKVEQAIDRLGYRYNSSGRVLRTNQTNTIAVIVPRLHPFFSSLIYHINVALSNRNHRMMLFITEADYCKENECIQLAVQNQVDGIIALTYNPLLKIPKDIRFVTIDRFFSKTIPCVASDNFEGGRLAVRKLHELGCRKLAMLFQTSHLRNEPVKRLDGFISGCKEHDLPYELCIRQGGFLDQFEIYDTFIANHVHDGRADFDGLFCGTDLIAWHATHTLRNLGVRVPEDVQIIGFDGIRAFSNQEYMVSTIVQPVEAIAETCVNTILSDDFSSRPSLICLPVEFAESGTTRKMA